MRFLRSHQKLEGVLRTKRGVITLNLGFTQPSTAFNFRLVYADATAAATVDTVQVIWNLRFSLNHVPCFKFCFNAKQDSQYRPMGLG